MLTERIINQKTENLEGETFTFAVGNHDIAKKRLLSERIFNLKGRISFNLAAGNYYIISRSNSKSNKLNEENIRSEYSELKGHEIKILQQDGSASIESKEEGKFFAENKSNKPLSKSKSVNHISSVSSEDNGKIIKVISIDDLVNRLESEYKNTFSYHLENGLNIPSKGLEGKESTISVLYDKFKKAFSHDFHITDTTQLSNTGERKKPSLLGSQRKENNQESKNNQEQQSNVLGSAKSKNKRTKKSSNQIGNPDQSKFKIEINLKKQGGSNCPYKKAEDAVNEVPKKSDPYDLEEKRKDNNTIDQCVSKDPKQRSSRKTRKQSEVNQQETEKDSECLNSKSIQEESSQSQKVEFVKYFPDVPENFSNFMLESHYSTITKNQESKKSKSKSKNERETPDNINNNNQIAPDYSEHCPHKKAFFCNLCNEKFACYEAHLNSEGHKQRIANQQKTFLNMNMKFNQIRKTIGKPLGVVQRPENLLLVNNSNIGNTGETENSSVSQKTNATNIINAKDSSEKGAKEMRDSVFSTLEGGFVGLNLGKFSSNNFTKTQSSGVIANESCFGSNYNSNSYINNNINHNQSGVNTIFTILGKTGINPAKRNSFDLGGSINNRGRNTGGLNSNDNSHMQSAFLNSKTNNLNKDIKSTNLYMIGSESLNKNVLYSKSLSKLSTKDNSMNQFTKNDYKSSKNILISEFNNKNNIELNDSNKGIKHKNTTAAETSKAKKKGEVSSTTKRRKRKNSCLLFSGTKTKGKYPQQQVSKEEEVNQTKKKLDFSKPEKIHNLEENKQNDQANISTDSLLNLLNPALSQVNVIGDKEKVINSKNEFSVRKERVKRNRKANSIHINNNKGKEDESGIRIELNFGSLVTSAQSNPQKKTTFKIIRDPDLEENNKEKDRNDSQENKLIKPPDTNNRNLLGKKRKSICGLRTGSVINNSKEKKNSQNSGDNLVTANCFSSDNQHFSKIFKIRKIENQETQTNNINTGLNSIPPSKLKGITNKAAEEYNKLGNVDRVEITRLNQEPNMSGETKKLMVVIHISDVDYEYKALSNEVEIKFNDPSIKQNIIITEKNLQIVAKEPSKEYSVEANSTRKKKNVVSPGTELNINEAHNKKLNHFQVNKDSSNNNRDSSSTGLITEEIHVLMPREEILSISNYFKEKKLKEDMLQKEQTKENKENTLTKELFNGKDNCTDKENKEDAGDCNKMYIDILPPRKKDREVKVEGPCKANSSCSKATTVREKKKEVNKSRVMQRKTSLEEPPFIQEHRARRTARGKNNIDDKDTRDLIKAYESSWFTSDLISKTAVNKKTISEKTKVLV